MTYTFDGDLRSIWDHVADALFIVDPSNGRFLNVNRHACISLRYTREELLSMYVWDIDREAQSRKDPQLIWSRLVPGQPVTFEGEHRRKDGTVFPVEVRGDLVIIDGKKCLLALARDLTDRKQTEALLRESEQSLRSLVGNMNEGLCLHELVFDSADSPTDYRILDVNPAYERILNVSREDVVGRLGSEAYLAGVAPYLDAYSEVALTGDPTAFETYFPPLEKHFSISVFRPSPNRFATIFTDITERKRTELERQKLLEELEAKNAELERFTYTVSHDLKSPLITVTGYLGHLKDDLAGNDSGAVQEDIQRITRAAETMAQLLDELLELSRLGRIVNPPEEFALSDLVREAREQVAGRLAATGATVEVASDLPTVYGDRQRILEVFQNLLENAAKYMGDQPNPRIVVGWEERKGETLVYVRDNGQGIETQFHKKIFDLFTQIDPSVEGTGIGLALVQRIVDIHGGRIWVESDGIGTGSTFYLKLPSSEGGP